MIEALAWVLLVAPVVPWTCFGLLAVDIASPNMPLRERVGIALRDALAASGLSLLAANVLFDLHIEDSLRLLVIAFVVLSVSVPSAIWLYLYASGRFR